MYLISHPLMVLPLLRITQGKKEVGGRKGMAREEDRGWGAVTEALRKREQDLRKAEGGRGNQGKVESESKQQGKYARKE